MKFGISFQYCEWLMQTHEKKKIYPFSVQEGNRSEV